MFLNKKPEMERVVKGLEVDRDIKTNLKERVCEFIYSIACCVLPNRRVSFQRGHEPSKSLSLPELFSMESVIFLNIVLYLTTEVP